MVNEEIQAEEVRLISPEGKQLGIVPYEQALEKAGDADMDLVLMSDEATPPVCKILDYNKHLFNKKKARQAGGKKQKIIHVKETKFRPGTDDGDYQVKLRNLIRFLEHGDKAKVTLRFRGRELAHQELGVELLQRIQKDLYLYGDVEQFPEKLEGRQMTMVVSPLPRSAADKRKREAEKDLEQVQDQAEG